MVTLVPDWRPDQRLLDPYIHAAENGHFVPEDDDEAESRDLVEVRVRYPRLDLAALLAEERPEREWLIPGLVPVGASVALIAPAGSMKSLILLSLMLAIARGDHAWAGLRIPRRRRVLYVDLELTEDDVAERMTDLQVTSQEAAVLDDLVYLHLPSLPPLDSAEGGRDIDLICDAYEIGAGDVVVLDSTQRILAGPEDASDTLRAYYAHTGLRLKRRGLTVFRTDNTGKDVAKGARGSSSKRDDVDLELFLIRTGSTITLTAGKTRQRDAASSVIVSINEDDTGRVSFSTERDPFIVRVNALIGWLDAIGADPDLSQRSTAELLALPENRLPEPVPRAVLRAAVRERKTALKEARKSAPPVDGAPISGEGLS